MKRLLAAGKGSANGLGGVGVESISGEEAHQLTIYSSAVEGAPTAWQVAQL